MKHARAHSILPTFVPRSTSYDGRFGRIFGKLPPWVPPGDTDEEREANIRTFAEAKMFLAEGIEPTLHPNLPAGYTYVGQFIDHDITFDPTSSLGRQNDPDGLKNFRSPRLDLDSIYGRGPDDQPYLYQQGGPDAFGFLKTGVNTGGIEPDLPRVGEAPGEATALIGDPRNDENIIVAQLQLAVIQLHNEVLRRVRHLDDKAKVQASAAGKTLTIDPRAQFHEAQRIVRWFYQYLVWNDFVRRLVPLQTWQKALAPSGTGAGRSLGLKDVFNWKVHPYIPVEFSVAVYRFGHSLVRTGYQLNLPRQTDENGKPGIGPDFELPVFDPTRTGKPDLRGSRPLPHLHTIEWDWFFDMASRPPFPQLANLLDPTPARSVFHIEGGASTNPLASLNILRGWRFELPSGSSLARAMGFQPIPITDPMEESLWVYILKEALLQQQGERLGEVGGTIVAAVFAGLLKGDPLSYVEQFPDWTPAAEPALAFGPRNPGMTNIAEWEFADLIAIANMPITGSDVGLVVANGPLPPPDISTL